MPGSCLDLAQDSNVSSFFEIDYPSSDPPNIYYIVDQSCLFVLSKHMPKISKALEPHLLRFKGKSLLIYHIDYFTNALTAGSYGIQELCFIFLHLFLSGQLLSSNFRLGQFL